MIMTNPPSNKTQKYSDCPLPKHLSPPVLDPALLAQGLMVPRRWLLKSALCSAPTSSLQSSNQARGGGFWVHILGFPPHPPDNRILRPAAGRWPVLQIGAGDITACDWRSLLQYLTCKGGTFEPCLGNKKGSKLQPMEVQDGADKEQVLSGPLTLPRHSLLERGL